MRSKNSMLNILSAMLLQIITLIVGVILPRVMLLCFGSEINGLVSSIRQFINYLNLVEAGLAGACVYSLYRPLAKKDYERINLILSSTKTFYNRSGIIFSILAFLLAIIFPYIVESKTLNHLAISILVIIFGVNGSLEFFSMGKYRALLTADQKSYIISIIQAIGQILNCFIICSLAFNKFNIVIVQAVATISYLVRSFLLSIYVNKNYSYINFNFKAEKNILHQRWDVIFHQIASMVVFNSPIAIITVFCSLIEVSIYTTYNIVFAGINGLISVFNNGLMAIIGEIISIGDKQKLKQIYREYECGYYMVITWIYSCTYILILPFINIYTEGVKDANYLRPDIAICFIIIGILNTLRIPQVTFVNAAGHYKQTRYRALLEVVINLLASLIFAHYLGLIGVLIGSICSYTYRTIDYIHYVPKYITDLSMKETVLRIIRMLFIIITIILPFETIFILNIETFIEWGIISFIISLWSGIIVLIGNFIFEKNMLINIFKRMHFVFLK